MLLHGIFPPITTPFYPQGNVYFKKIEHNVERYSKTPVAGIVVLGSTGEAILLSDRIMLMTNGPAARIAEIVDVTIPRPRSRESIIEHPHYYKIRNHVIHFLVRHAKHGPSGDGGPPDQSVSEAPLQVNFERASSVLR